MNDSKQQIPDSIGTSFDYRPAAFSLRTLP
jgi:hypothetical protein